MIPKIPASNLVRSDGVLKGSVSLIGLVNPTEWPELVIVQTETVSHGDVNNVYRRTTPLSYFREDELEGQLDLCGYAYVADGLPSLHLLNP